MIFLISRCTRKGLRVFLSAFPSSFTDPQYKTAKPAARTQSVTGNMRARTVTVVAAAAAAIIATAAAAAGEGRAGREKRCEEPKSP